MNTLDICMVICVSFFFMFLFVIGIKDTNNGVIKKRCKRVTTSDIKDLTDQLYEIKVAVGFISNQMSLLNEKNLGKSVQHKIEYKLSIMAKEIIEQVGSDKAAELAQMMLEVSLKRANHENKTS